MTVRVYTIPPHAAFADVLAAGIAERHGGDDPMALARVVVLLPTRRARIALSRAFLRLGDGRPMLLPRLLPLGDLDEEPGLAPLPPGATAAALPPAIGSLHRQLLLARLVTGSRPMPVDRAAHLAAELARLIDHVQTERLAFDSLADLVPEEFAQHWQITLEFLRIVAEHWPGIVAAEGLVDPAARRNAALKAWAAAWAAAPPATPVIAAGSTGSVPATAALLGVVAGLEHGAVVLPGLDRDLDADSWQALAPSHPQYGLRRLLGTLGVARADVADWDAGAAAAAGGRGAARAALLREAMRPAETAERWAGLDPAPLAAGREGLVRIDAAAEREEAGIVALLLRRALEGEGTAALVTPDRGLARRVAAALTRWGIVIDDSAGTRLADTPPGAFLRLVAELAADWSPVALLSVLKHPLAAGGRRPAEFRRLARRLERAALRGPRPAPGIDGLRAATADRPGLADWLDDLERRLTPFLAVLDGAPRPLSELVAAHVAAAQALSVDEGGAPRLWGGDAGRAAAEFVSDLQQHAGILEAVPPAQYPALLETLMTAVTVRPQYGRHPRLAILGPLEARMQQVDLIVLGGLNEGTWPAEPGADPWMSRPMRADFGLPPAEQRIGLAAHDFVSAAAAPDVVLIRAARVGGAPSVPARWLTRLDTVLHGAGLPGLPRETVWADWLDALDRPDGPPRPWPAPEPRPPVAARPRRLSVTRIEMWRRDPYSIYARFILDLRALDPIDAQPDAGTYGTVVHRALDAFMSAHPTGPLPADAVDRLLAAGRAEFAGLASPTVQAFWWPRFVRIAEWVVGREQTRRQGVARLWSEVTGQLEIAAPAGPFTLTAKADRIERRADGRLVILDYKTGAPPSKRQVAAGFAPQLPLEGVIAAAGGFAGIAAAEVGGLAYWRLSGGETAGVESSAGDDPEALCGAAGDGLARLVAEFDDAKTAYISRPRPDMAPAYSDYEHLARVREWAAAAGDGE